MPDKPDRAGTEARRVKTAVKQFVLHEAGYKCSNPACRHPLTLDIHHLYYVCEGGSGDANNLLPLCPNCHAQHHSGGITTESLRAWKMLLLTLNEAFDRRSIDILLALDKLGHVDWITGDGLPAYAALAASNLIAIDVQHYVEKTATGFNHHLYRAQLTGRGKMFVEHWKNGDQEAAIGRLTPRCSTEDHIVGNLQKGTS